MRLLKDFSPLSILSLSLNNKAHIDLKKKGN